MASQCTQTSRGNARFIRARCTALSQPPHASILMRQACRPDRMVDIGFPELLTLVQTVAIILAIVIAVYFSRLQIQALKTDTEARVVNDLDEKLHRIGESFMEKPEFVRILNDDAAVSNFGAEVAFAFYVMFFCSHCYHMRLRGILTDNDWAGWLQWTKNAFRSGRLGKYWKEAEMQAWVDPAFREFVNREILVGPERPWGGIREAGCHARRFRERLPAEDGRMARPQSHDGDLQGARGGPCPDPADRPRRRPPGGPVRPRRPHEGRLCLPERTLSLLAARARPGRPSLGIVR